MGMAIVATRSAPCGRVAAKLGEAGAQWIVMSSDHILMHRDG